MSKKIIFFIIIVIQIYFTKISYAQFTNPLDSIFNEIGKGIENVTKSISEGVQKSDEKNIDIKDENKETEIKEINKSATATSVEKKIDKKDREYKPQCDNPKMAELLKENSKTDAINNPVKEIDNNLYFKKRPELLPAHVTDEQWQQTITTAKQKNASYIGISNNSATKRVFWGGGGDISQAQSNSLLECTRQSGSNGNYCEFIFIHPLSDPTKINTPNFGAKNQTSNMKVNNQAYSRDPLLNKFFESYSLYAQSTAILMEAYGKDQEAAIIRQSIIDSKNPNKADHEKFSNTLTVVSENGNNLKDLIYCRTEPLSADSKKKYEEAIPYAVKAVLTSVELKFMIGATAKNLKQAAQGDPLAAGLTALVYASYAPQVIEYLSSIGNTFSFILTGAKANNIEGSPKLQSTLKDL